jgi:hypothetical protein
LRYPLHRVSNSRQPFSPPHHKTSPTSDPKILCLLQPLQWIIVYYRDLKLRWSQNSQFQSLNKLTTKFMLWNQGVPKNFTSRLDFFLAEFIAVCSTPLPQGTEKIAKYLHSISKY